VTLVSRGRGRAHTEAHGALYFTRRNYTQRDLRIASRTEPVTVAAATSAEPAGWRPPAV
jgi:hypothetical protein